MEMNNLNKNLYSEITLKCNYSNENPNTIPGTKNEISKRSRNLRLLAAKTEEIFDKKTISNIMISNIYNTISNSEDDLILENLISKGLLNQTLEYKIDEYKKELKKKLKTKESLSEISLINEIKFINRNILISSIEHENLFNLKDFKEKKIDILENSIVSINEKKKNLKNIIYKSIGNNIKNTKEEGNINKKCSVNKSFKNILLENYEIFSYDLLKDLRINCEERDPIKLQKVKFT